MTRRRMTAALAGCLALTVCATTASAANWADSLFAERNHHFGPVPRGAKVKHDFVLVNRLREAITIVGLRPSCGCTSGQANASVVGPGQSAVVEAQMDTRNFVGEKSTILFVSVVTAGGKEAEVRLHVTSTILADVVLNPGSIDFGTVVKGQAPTLTLTVDRINAPDWRFTRMVSASRAITAQLVETKRDASGAVSYRLDVGVKPDAPSGPLRAEIQLISNDPETRGVPVPVTGWIRGDLSASPSLLSLGEVVSAEPKQGKFIVRASQPFAITGVEGVGDGFSIAPYDGSRKTMHILTVSYDAEQGTTRGDLQHVFRVATDIPGEPPLDLTATAHVAP